MAIPTEPIGSIPRPAELIGAGQDLAAGRITAQAYAQLAEAAVGETIAELEATGSPVITDGEQGKPSFATYPLAGLDTLAPDGVVIPFADGHTRQLPRLTAGPFRYTHHAGRLWRARTRTEHLTWASSLGTRALPPRLSAHDPVVRMAGAACAQRRLEGHGNLGCCGTRSRSCAARSPVRSRTGLTGP